MHAAALAGGPARVTRGGVQAALGPASYAAVDMEAVEAAANAHAEEVPPPPIPMAGVRARAVLARVPILDLVAAGSHQHRNRHSAPHEARLLAAANNPALARQRQ